MEQQFDWPSIIGALGGLMGVAAVLKVARDWWRDRGTERLNGEEQVRAALLAQNTDLRQEIEQLREELAEARRELNRIARDAEKRLRECEQRAVGFQRELATIQAEVQYLRARHAP